MKHIHHQEVLFLEHFTMHFCAEDQLTEGAEELQGCRVLPVPPSPIRDCPSGAQLLVKVDASDASELT